MFSLFHGLWKNITKKNCYSILFLGLNDSGKTSFLNEVEKRLSKEKLIPSPVIPTIGQNTRIIV
jgi:ADP-ribosylation factor related protein 1